MPSLDAQLLAHGKTIEVATPNRIYAMLCRHSWDSGYYKNPEMEARLMDGWHFDPLFIYDVPRNLENRNLIDAGYWFVMATVDVDEYNQRLYAATQLAKQGVSIQIPVIGLDPDDTPNLGALKLITKTPNIMSYRTYRSLIELENGEFMRVVQTDLL
tara:strand:+ start:30603 stop:31073 length:471 start_codon:yes stop_codon:yes gene_type:complete